MASRKQRQIWQRFIPLVISHNATILLKQGTVAVSILQYDECLKYLRNVKLSTANVGFDINARLRRRMRCFCLSDGYRFFYETINYRLELNRAATQNERKTTETVSFDDNMPHPQYWWLKNRSNLLAICDLKFQGPPPLHAAETVTAQLMT